MDKSPSTMAHQIAEAASAFEQRRTGHGREWLTVFLNEDTLVILLYGALSPAEKALAKSSAGAAQVREFHRQLFTHASDSLRRKIKSITGMEVRDATAEVATTTGTVVQVFTTGTAVEEFLLARSAPNGHLEPEGARRNGPPRPDECRGRLGPCPKQGAQRLPRICGQRLR